MIKINSRFPAFLSKHIFFIQAGVEGDYVSKQSGLMPHVNYKNVK